MVLFEDQYYNINRKLLMVAGLWPYQKWRSRVIQITLFLGVLISFLMAQLATFVTSGFHMKTVLKVLSQAFPCLIYILKYISFVVNSRGVKECYERIRYEWTILKVQNEIDILKRYANFSRLFSMTLMVVLFVILVIFGSYQYLPDFLDMIAPLNKSRKHYLTFEAEYFVDQEEYFYPIVTHGLAAVCFGGVGVIASGAMLLTYTSQICAMLKIASIFPTNLNFMKHLVRHFSYRLEHVSDDVPSVSNTEKDHIVRERIINAVNIHRRAIEFAEFIISTFALFYFFLIGIGISSLTLNMFQFLQLMMVTDDINGMLACGLLVICHFAYLFIANAGGQIVTDHNTDIFHTTYATRWYKISVQSQKLLLLILRRNTKNYYFVIGGLFTASLEGFATMTSMSISYFTVIYSTS